MCVCVWVTRISVPNVPRYNKILPRYSDNAGRRLHVIHERWRSEESEGSFKGEDFCNFVISACDN